MGKKKKRREKQTMFTYWNFIVSGNGIIATTIPTVDLVSRQGRRDPKKDRKAERTDEEGFIASRSSISLHVHRGPPTLPLSLYEQATETCFSTGRPHLPPLFSNPGSTGPLLLPQRPRYFVVVSSSMPPFFVSCSPFVSFFDSLSLSPTPILSSQFHLAAFPSYIFFYFVFRLILQFLRILFILPEW